MFSDHLHIPKHISGRTWWAIAAALVILCQLVAMGMVADGQVKKAAMRDSQLTQQRVALAQCFEGSLGSAARNSCVRQVYNNGSDGSTMAAVQPSGGKLMAYDRSAVRSPAQGVMAVSFASN